MTSALCLLYWVLMITSLLSSINLKTTIIVSASSTAPDVKKVMTRINNSNVYSLETSYFIASIVNKRPHRTKLIKRISKNSKNAISINTCHVQSIPHSAAPTVIYSVMWAVFKTIHEQITDSLSRGCRSVLALLLHSGLSSNGACTSRHGKTTNTPFMPSLVVLHVIPIVQLLCSCPKNLLHFYEDIAKLTDKEKVYKPSVPKTLIFYQIKCFIL